MAETMQFDLVSPERRLASFLASSVEIPGADGDLTVMAGHTPVITTLRPGVLKVEGPEGKQSYLVSGGFARISAGAASVLAEKAMTVGDVRAEDMDMLIAAANETVGKASGDARDVAERQLADLQSLRSVIGV